MTAVYAAPGAGIDERLARISAQLDELTADVRRQREQRDALAELLADLTPIARQALASTTDRLDDLEARGHLDFARATLGIADRVMTSFSADDVEALGDNIVFILETVKEMTQPDVLALLRHTAAQVNEPVPPAAPPTLLALLRELRDPEVRRGLTRLLDMLRTAGAPAGAATQPQPEEV